MGIRNLNRFFKENASKNDAIKFLSLSKLSGKKVAVDISIYMYKFVGDDSLIENIYLMLSIFIYYNITPIFIFDGKAPTEKSELLQKRRQDKKEAEKEYEELKKMLDLIKEKEIKEKELIKKDIIKETLEIEKQEIIYSMDMLKRKIITISKKDIEHVKALIDAHGLTYYDATGEADELCALLCLKEKVWACLSEDMDMFVFGCPRVIRYISLLNHTAVLYDTQKILENLGITQKELREICVLSGTDYNMIHTNNENEEKNKEKEVKENKDLNNKLKYFKNFQKYINTEKDTNKDNNRNTDFYEYLLKNTQYISDKDIILLKKVGGMFDLNSINNIQLKIMDDTQIINRPIQKLKIKEILKLDGFIFPLQPE